MSRLAPRDPGRSQLADIESAPNDPSNAGPTTGPRSVSITVIVTGPLPFTSITSSRVSHGTSRSPRRTVVPSGPTSSTNRSVLSVSPAVIPHAACPLWPAAIEGAPGTEAPVTVHSGVCRWARYQWGGRRGARWGSFATSGLPLRVRDPAIAQLFDPPAGELDVPIRGEGEGLEGEEAEGIGRLERCGAGAEQRELVRPASPAHLDAGAYTGGERFERGSMLRGEG